MTPLTAWPWPSEYKPLRLLAESRGGVVALAMDSRGELVALKLLHLTDDAKPEEALLRHKRLGGLTTRPGLLPILACGMTSDQKWIWESLAPADNLDGNPASNAEDYFPFNLRAHVIQHGPLPVDEVIQAGLTIAEGLAALHGAGLVHRDVKPGNCFRTGGKFMLGDYGLVSDPGGMIFAPAGTEGFVPPDGAGNEAGDWYALGKTLYEIWTGRDRLEFPTIPKAILQNTEWHPVGAALNGFLLRACSARAADRYVTAAGFMRDLNSAAQGRLLTMNRRRWLTAAGVTAGALAGGGLFWIKARSQPVIHWRRLSQWRNVPDCWHDYAPVVDERRGCLYSLRCRQDCKTVHRIDLRSWEHSMKHFKLPEVAAFGAILHPTERTLWFAENSRGPVWRVDPESGEFSRVGGKEPAVDTDFGNGAYWNPLSKRLGSFSGYGQYQVHNWRWEFEVESGLWIEVEKNDPSRRPMCRSTGALIPINGGQKLLMLGGQGNTTGRQGERDGTSRFWTAQFHVLGDLWSLDLASGKWECVVPVPGLELPNATGTAYVERANVLVVTHSNSHDSPIVNPPEIYIHRLKKGDPFEKVLHRGEIPVDHMSNLLVALPGGKRIAAFLATGIYEMTLEV